MKAQFITLLIFCTLFFIACDKNGEPPLTTTPPTSQDNLGEANLGFGLSLLQELDKTIPIDENILISPVSIQTAMNMAANGADGQTLSQILTGLHTAEWDLDEVNQRQAAWQQILTNSGGHPEVLMANGYFEDPNRINTFEEFKQKIKQYYNASVEQHDFNSQAAVDNINAWVNDQTKGKIDKILEGIDDEEIAFLINALYFRADWLEGFDPNATSYRDFNLPNGNQVSTPFMTADRLFNYVQSEDYTALEIPFKDETFSLTLAMPSTDINLQQFIKKMNSGYINEMYEEMSENRAIAYIPHLDLSYKEDLKNTLIAVGIDDAFSNSKADFTKLGESLIGPRIFITRVDHKSVLKIDEYGAEGAAVTSVGFGVTSMPPVLDFNRPFVIILRHIETNSLLFIGRVANPAE